MPSEQAFGDGLQLGAVIGKDLPRLVVGVRENPFDLLVNFLSSLLGVLPALNRQRNVEKPRPLIPIVIDGPQLIAHAELGDHRPSDVGCALKIVMSAC